MFLVEINSHVISKGHLKDELENNNDFQYVKLYKKFYI